MNGDHTNKKGVSFFSEDLVFLDEKTIWGHFCQQLGISQKSTKIHINRKNPHPQNPH